MVQTIYFTKNVIVVIYIQAAWSNEDDTISLDLYILFPVETQMFVHHFHK